MAVWSRVGDVNPTASIHDQIVRPPKGLAQGGLCCDRCHGPPAIDSDHALALALGREQIAASVERKAVRRSRFIAKDVDTARWIQAIYHVGPKIGEVETPVRCADWAFGELEAFFYQLDCCARRNNTGNARREPLRDRLTTKK